MNLRELKEIFRLVEKTDFSEVEISQGDFKLRVGRGRSDLHTISQTAAAAPAPLTMTQAETPASLAAAKSEVKAEPVPAKEEYLVTSPFVGTFYAAPSPEAEPYVKVGQVVKKGQPLCIVEAMKLMNEIESDYDGKIVQVYPQNGQPVEFGAKLFRIEP